MRTILQVGMTLLLVATTAFAQNASTPVAPVSPPHTTPSNPEGPAPVRANHLPDNPVAPHGARVFIVSPQDGATVGQEVTVKFGAEGIAVAPSTESKADTGHHHLLIDVATLPPLDAPIPNDATHKHYGKGQTGDTIHLDPGTHTLQLDFADAAHMQFAPQLVSKKITIHVKQ